MDFRVYFHYFRKYFELYFSFLVFTASEPNTFNDRSWIGKLLCLSHKENSVTMYLHRKLLLSVLCLSVCLIAFTSFFLQTIQVSESLVAKQPTLPASKKVSGCRKRPQSPPHQKIHNKKAFHFWLLCFAFQISTWTNINKNCMAGGFIQEGWSSPENNLHSNHCSQRLSFLGQ